MRHHGFSHSSLYRVTSKQAPRNLLIESVESQTSITDRTPVLAKGRGKSGMLLHKGALITPMCRALFGLSPRCEAPIKQHCLIGVAQIAPLVAVYLLV